MLLASEALFLIHQFPFFSAMPNAYAIPAILASCSLSNFPIVISSYSYDHRQLNSLPETMNYPNHCPITFCLIV
nr:MAG TPA: hypothetical protein [Caudoviricetes sp.]